MDSHIALSAELLIVHCSEPVMGIIIKIILFHVLQVGRLKPEKAIPDAILRQAKGFAIVTVVKVGMMVTYKLGTGLVVARRADGSWSPPSAISTCGVGYGAQVTAFQVFLYMEGLLVSNVALSNKSDISLTPTGWR